MYKICRKFYPNSYLVRKFNISSTCNETHYEVLNLSKDCTKKEIKSAFITLSKQCHPDKSKALDTHAKFVRLSEAYHTLIDPISRQNYDLTLSNTNYTDVNHNQTVYNGRTKQWEDDSFWENRDKSQDKYYKSSPYYGINGITRVSNGKLVLIIFFVAVIGVGFQVALINFSTAFNRKQLDARSAASSKILKELQATAQRNGNEKQIEILKMRADALNNYRSQSD